jgi:alpha-beta hydrolase superfamily lysophospholipase
MFGRDGLGDEMLDEDVPVGVLEVETEAGRRSIAYRCRAARGPGRAAPGLVWLGGFGSQMRGIKARSLDRAASENGWAFLRFDYSGHGESGGRFEDGTIGLWVEESLAAFTMLTHGPRVIVGSSMGAWIALLVAKALAERGEAHRLAGLVLLAPAVDFTEKLVWDRMDDEARATLAAKGAWLRPSPYSIVPVPITAVLIEEGRRHLLLDRTIRTFCPVHIIHGMADDDVPWRHALTLVEHLAGDPVTVTLVKDGDHRLSRDEDLLRLADAVATMVVSKVAPRAASGAESSPARRRRGRSSREGPA